MYLLDFFFGGVEFSVFYVILLLKLCQSICVVSVLFCFMRLYFFFQEFPFLCDFTSEIVAEFSFFFGGGAFPSYVYGSIFHYNLPLIFMIRSS